MDSSQGLHCPRCHSQKYTSLPFGNIIRAAGSAKTYRCLACSFFFVRRAPTDWDLGTEEIALANAAARTPSDAAHWSR